MTSPTAQRWRRRTPDDLATPAGTLHRRLGRLDLTAMGVGTIVGAGIFVITGVAAAEKAGPAIVLSFALAGLVCVLVALCYSELAAMTPVSGSAYTYTYATLGEGPAFLVGWNLLLEFVIAGAAVAIGWSGTTVSALDSIFGITLPHAITASPSEGGVVNLPAVLIIGAIVAVLVGEVSLTARITKVLVAVTIGVLVLVVVVGAPHIDPGNWTPYAPFGWSGVIGGAAVAFFAFLGFDVVATSAEEARDPKRDIPFAIIGTVLVATVLYALVSAVLTGVAPFESLNNGAPIATAFGALDIGWIGTVIVVASVIALTKGLLLIVYAQVRLSFAMCRDGLLPRSLAATGKSATPVKLTLVLGVCCAAIAGLLPIDIVVELVNIGALSAFAVVCVGVLVLRKIEPGRERPFRTPLVPLVPILALLGCALMALTLDELTWVRFAIWVAIGVGVYFWYGRRHSAFAEAETVKVTD
ncbi:amino acid permease [Nocardia puris]|uniref:amino acid permease n=1 Tax=Nocardia puris TaxID=208602 RepID=UPI00189623A0|nr:amino acid permease [Nocardia puris]MBF6210620.1 amino acid permease [Nocardia puris]MBF6369346.1 amino acid permease [Nocardia puris]MBF6457881.1 amino acid permease [Nocardia puris]